MRLPEDLPESGLVLLFGFIHEARQDVGAWKRALTERSTPFLSLPTAADDLSAESMAPVAVAMRTHTPPAAWEGIVQIHQGGPALQKTFGWSPDAFAKVLRVGTGGEILGRHDVGPFSKAALDQVLGTLAP